MAIIYPSYAQPQPTDFLSSLAKGYQFGQQVQGDILDQQSLSKLADYAQQLQQPREALPPGAIADRAAELRAATGAGAPPSYAASVAASESGGQPNAVNPTTGAAGLYQFLPSTWQDLTQRHPELGLTADGITDPAQQQKALPVFTADNARVLQSNGIPPSPGSLYAAHFLGGEGAAKVLTAPDNTPIASIAPEAAQANPNIAGMNVGQFKDWALQQGTRGNGGYAPPAQGYRLDAGVPQGAGLPDRSTLIALLRAPSTRSLAQQMISAAQQGQTPANLLDMAYKQAQINAVGLPAGYRRTTDGQLQAIPGGPDDPTNPLNTYKINPFGSVGATSGPPGGQGLPANGAAIMQQLAPDTQNFVKGMLSYQIDPSKVPMKQRTSVLQLLTSIDPSYDMSQYPARAAYLKKVQSGAYADSINSANTTIDHLSQLLDNADQLHNSNFPLWNAASNAVKSQTGSAAVTNFDENAKAAGDELAKFFKGTGATDVGSIEAWHGSLDANASPDQQRGAIATAIGLLKSRLDVLRQQYNETMGRDAGYSQFLHPDTQQTLVKLGYDPQTLEPTGQGATQGAPTAAPSQQAAPTTKTIGGTTYVQDGNGDWYEQN